MSKQDKKEEIYQVDDKISQNESGDKLVKQKSSSKGDFAVWLITILILVAFGVVIYFLGRWGGIQKEYFATLSLPEEVRVGQKNYLQLTFDNDYAVMDQEIVWLVDEREVKRGEYGSQDILTLPLTELSEGQHQVAILVGDKEIVRKSFVVKKPLLKIALPKVNLYYGQKLQEPLKAVATGWISDEDEKRLGFDGSVAFNDDNLKVGKYGLTYEGFCCDEYELKVQEGYVNVLPLKVKVESVSFNKVYDGDVKITPTNIKLNGVLEGDQVVCNLKAEFLDKNAGKNKRIKVVEYSLSGKDAQNYHLDLSEIDFKGNITPLLVRLEGLVAMDKVYDGTTAVTFKNGGELKGVLQGDLVSVGVINASFVDANKGENKQVVVKNVSLVGADSGNYQVETTDITASILGKKTSAVHGNN